MLTALFNSCFGEILGGHDQVTVAGALVDVVTTFGTNTGNIGYDKVNLAVQEMGNGNTVEGVWIQVNREEISPFGHFFHHPQGG